MSAPTLSDVETEISDAADVLLVLFTMLSEERTPLVPSMRDAVATTVRLARDRVAAARELLDAIQGARR